VPPQIWESECLGKIIPDNQGGMYLTYDMKSAFLYCTVLAAAHKNKINPFRQLTAELRVERFGKEVHWRQAF